MLSGWTIREVAIHVLAPVSVIVGAGWLVAWLSPVGVTNPTKLQLALLAIGFSAVFVAVRNRRNRQETASIELFLDTVPTWVWIVFAGAHGVVLGTALGLAWQMPLLPLMLGGGAIAAGLGAFLPRLRR